MKTNDEWNKRVNEEISFTSKVSEEPLASRRIGAEKTRLIIRFGQFHREGNNIMNQVPVIIHISSCLRREKILPPVWNCNMRMRGKNLTSSLGQEQIDENIGGQLLPRARKKWLEVRDNYTNCTRWGEKWTTKFLAMRHAPEKRSLEKNHPNSPHPYKHHPFLSPTTTATWERYSARVRVIGEIIQRCLRLELDLRSSPSPSS